MGRLLMLAGTAYKLVCYFTNWAHSRPGPASIMPRDLDPFLCTHLIFAFASMSNNQIVAKNLQDENVLYPEFNKLKERNRELKTLLSIGGWNFGTSRFTTMMSTFANREKFIDSVISFLRMHGFDGLDLFFLYPGLRGSPPYDRWNFLFLIEELQFAFKREALLTQHPRLLLSAAVSGIPYVIQTSYDARLLGRCLDFINVLSYDLHGSWEKFTGHNSPLFSIPEDSKSSAYAMNYWRKLGTPTDKLIMGFPTYGRTFHLLKESKNGLQAASMGPASPGKYTKQAGFLAYYEVCSFVQRAKQHWIDYQYVPYALKGKEWLGYDDTSSFSYKAMYVKREHFGGAMVWTLDMDDVRGTFCGNGPFPLVHILHELLVQAESNSTPLPQFWFTSSVNASGPGSENLAVTEVLTTDTIKILPLGGEAMVTEVHRKYKNMTTIPSGRFMTPGGTASPRKHSVTTESNTMASEAKTMTTLDFSKTTTGIFKTTTGIPKTTTGISETTIGISKTTTGIPKTTTGIPNTTTGISETAIGISKTTTGIPKTTTGIPKTTTGISKTTTGISKTITGIPKTTTGIPKTTTGIPETTTGIPETTTGIPEITTEIPKTTTGILKTTTGIPKTTTGISKTTTGISKTTTGIPKTTTGISKTTTGIPKTTTGIPKTTTGIFKTITGIPKTTAGIPKTTTGIPKTTTGISKTITGIPKTTAGIPRTATGISKTTAGMTVTVQTQENEGETTATMAHQSVTPTGIDMTLVYLQTMKSSERETSRKKTVVSEKITVPPREMSATSNGQSTALKWESLITEVETYPKMGEIGLPAHYPVPMI
ncbi:LOW QUALITY PROTEIN: oviduct-specific glycoprotein [Apodemus sylvaticus]|uniref:LOW QUALITY PROTEIN: oviduct-specific glycoprotein n=1 Tax=Apodemus sylvaticus TaxID=10129 RepID=UPI002243ED83|nr:LOW QUALITY PROTEIN: oviduct-specific glycoprotein [Apodemus sylvaticus]